MPEQTIEQLQADYDELAVRCRTFDTATQDWDRQWQLDRKATLDDRKNERADLLRQKQAAYLLLNAVKPAVE